MISEQINSNDINLTLIPISKSDLLNEIENLLKKYFSNVPQTEPELQNNFIDIETFCSLHPKKPAKATIYSQLSLKKIPSELVFKPQGSKKVLFYKDLVLQWIDNGMPTNVQSLADDYINNRK
jgi:hypothetical protein